jgi:hypothetical protein
LNKFFFENFQLIQQKLNEYDKNCLLGPGHGQTRPKLFGLGEEKLMQLND